MAMPRPALLRRLPASLVCALLLVACVPHQAPADLEPEPAIPEGFSYVVEHSEEGMTATCERGCAWTELSARYSPNRYRISDEGVSPGGRQAIDGHSPGAAGFQHQIILSDSGISATCEHGCNWSSVSATSPIGAYRITAEGIVPLR